MTASGIFLTLTRMVSKMKKLKTIFVIIVAACFALFGAVLVSGCGNKPDNDSSFIETPGEGETPGEDETPGESSGGLKDGGIYEAH